MKKLVFASVMALASLSLVSAPMLRAQDSTITIKDPAEFNTYQNASTQKDPQARAAALESFLETYPQSVVKSAVLDSLIDTYQSLQNSDKALSAASRQLQVDPNNMKAIFISVFIKKSQCAKTQNAQTCDDAAVLAHKGLLVPKSAGMADADWKKLTGGTYPIFHSAIALDDAIAKKDFKGAVAEYTAELMLYTDDQTKTVGLQDTLLLAQAYAQPGAMDLVKSIWFYSRAWNFVPASYKPTVEKSLDYYYKKYHGDLKGLDDIKAQAALTTFPPGTLVIAKAKTPAEQIHDLILTTPNLTTLNLSDKEFILAAGAKEDADKLWAVLKDQATPVPGTVIEAPASAMKVVVIQGVKPRDFTVNLQNQTACKDFPAAGSDMKQQQDFILSSGVKADTDELGTIFADPKPPIKKIEIEPLVSAIKVAVTDDAKAAKISDFIVRLKTPVPCKEAPAAGFDYGQQSKGEAELDGTYDTYRQVPATATLAQTAEIVLRDGVIVPEKKRSAAPHKPAAGHHK
jgi:tetratricopeptide (TPR) repeat protein